jgi:two-component system cell cycle response regulator CpdR
MAVDANIHVIFITGFAAVAMKQLDAAKQDTKVLSKPFHLRQLIEEIERELAA